MTQKKKISSPMRFLIEAFSLLVTLVTIILPWQLRYRFSFFLARSSFWIMKYSDRFYTLALEAKFIGQNEATLIKSKKDYSNRVDGGKKEVAILFSGGSDSTLATIYLAKDFKRIHLLTFYHDAIPDNGKRAFKMTKKLREHYGNEIFVHKFINVQDIFNKVYRKNHFRDLWKYGLFHVNLCAACKLSMLLAIIKYCLENNIKIVVSGSNKDAGDLISDQMVKVSEILEEFFMRHDLIYMTPVYNVDRSDWELYNLGFTDVKDTKARVARSANTNQAYCENSFPYMIYAKGYHVPRYGQKSLENISVKWYKEKIKKYEKIIPNITLNPINEREEPNMIIARLEFEQ